MFSDPTIQELVRDLIIGLLVVSVLYVRKLQAKLMIDVKETLQITKDIKNSLPPASEKAEEDITPVEIKIKGRNN